LVGFVEKETENVIKYHDLVATLCENLDERVSRRFGGIGRENILKEMTGEASEGSMFHTRFFSVPKIFLLSS
jgi:hypothetical protein